MAWSPAFSTDSIGLSLAFMTGIWVCLVAIHFSMDKFRTVLRLSLKSRGFAVAPVDMPALSQQGPSYKAASWVPPCSLQYHPPTP